jgi:hypothetical protein
MLNDQQRENAGSRDSRALASIFSVATVAGIWIAILALMLCSVRTADAAERNTSLINSFQVLCALETPAFEKINDKAVAMKLPVRRDIGQSRESGEFAHSKSWLITLRTGPHELIAAEANGPQGYVQSCGISAVDPNGEVFKDELVSMMNLDLPSLETVSEDGVTRVTEWKDAFEAGTLLQLVDATPKNKSGVILLYVLREATKP